MLFNSLTYAIFLPIVFAIYWSLRNNYKWQNIFLLLASYVFYAWWNWRFLGLLVGMSLVSWIGGKYISMASNMANASEGGGAMFIRKEIASCINCYS